MTGGGGPAHPPLKGTERTNCPKLRADRFGITRDKANQGLTPAPSNAIVCDSIDWLVASTREPTEHGGPYSDKGGE